MLVKTLSSNSINIWVGEQRTHIMCNSQSAVNMSSTSDQPSRNIKQAEEQQYTKDQYRTIQKQIPRLRPNTPPVCKNKRSYKLITRRTASDTGKVFYECRKITNDYHNLNKHCRIHTGEKPYHCTVCKKAFSDKSDYDVHYRNTYQDKTL